MKAFAKALSVFINLASYAAGIAVALILVFKWDFISIFYINGMTSNESLLFNLVIFETVLALTGIVLCLLINEYKKSDKTVEFPLIYEIIPVIAAAISIFYCLSGETVSEKIICILFAVIYAILSAAVIYCGARVFQLYPKDKK